ncbi:MAG TPA: beta-ketoacyl synthase N-terminal-like domain-containing protein [Phycisphaerae bacterium]|nr:beta-ketoacyl synthase N-terminal-like domain-containing protein [Phycisphaerae bacterium]
MRRVVVTGLGVISPHGLSTADFFKALSEGHSSTAPLTTFDPSGFPTRVAGAIPAFKITDYVPKSYRKATKIMARDIELAIVAADGAVRDAKLATRGILEFMGGKKPDDSWFSPDPSRVGCNIGAGLLAADLNELTAAFAQAKNPDGTLSLTRWGKSDDPAKTSGMDQLTPLWLLKYLPNMLACHVSIIHDTQGPSNTITCGQASAGLSLAEACRSIQRDCADIALVGGFETILHLMGLMRWSLLNRLTTTSNDQPAAACRPLDQAAAGTVPAEGGAVLVIEELQHARARGARIYCEIAGLGASSSALGVGPPDSSGEALGVAMTKALKDAKITSDAVQMVVPSGYGIPQFDRHDAHAIQRVFGLKSKVTVAPVRGGIGDMAAGSQALDLAAGALAIHAGKIFPAVNCPNPIEGLSVPQFLTSANLEHVMVATESLSGQNAAVVLKRYA